MAIHPDDPPWSIFGLPRIITSGDASSALIDLVDLPANGVTFCTGSLGADPNNDLPAIARRIGGRGRIHFAHCRNVAITGPRQFNEAPHPSRFGNVPMHDVLSALHDVGFTGPMRPDHGRMIWGETRPAWLRALRSGTGRDVSPGTVGRAGATVIAHEGTADERRAGCDVGHLVRFHPPT